MGDESEDAPKIRFGVVEGGAGRRTTGRPEAGSARIGPAPGQPGKVRLLVDRVVTARQAAEIMLILKEGDGDDAA